MSLNRYDYSIHLPGMEQAERRDKLLISYFPPENSQIPFSFFVMNSFISYWWKSLTLEGKCFHRRSQPERRRTAFMELTRFWGMTQTWKLGHWSFIKTDENDGEDVSICRY